MQQKPKQLRLTIFVRCGLFSLFKTIVFFVESIKSAVRVGMDFVGEGIMHVTVLERSTTTS
jgi:hypothetical protein